MSVVTSVPLVDLKAQHAAIGGDIESAIARVEERQVFINGPETRAFEEEYRAFCEAPYCIAVSSGTSALELVLRALEVGPDDEVVTVSHTFFATVGSILSVGAVPVFVDVDPDTWTISSSAVRAAITARTRAILVVHLYGNPADVQTVADAAPGIPIIEDAAQAHGARYDGRSLGSVGLAACYSFYPGKTLGAHGDAGAVTTHDDELGERIRALRDHGRAGEKYEHRMLGTNARMSELQAAVLRAKLPYLPEWVRARQRIAAAYEHQLRPAGLPMQTTRESNEHGRHLFAVLMPERDRVAATLRDRGIATGMHYPVPCHKQPVMRSHRSRITGSLDVTDRLAATCLSLPLYPELGKRAAISVADTVSQALR